MKRLCPLLPFLLLVASVAAQDRRPIPYPVIPDANFRQALDNGTRTPTGQPGDAYWTNTADYTISASLSPASGTVRGTATAVYHNNSPDALPMVAVHLHQNLHAEGGVRNRSQEVTGGMQLSRVAVDGRDLLEASRFGGVGYRIDGTVMWIRMPRSLAPGDSATFEFGWSYRVPGRGAPRNGTDGEVWFMAYWYPQFAVYDDIQGWKADQYFGNGEFYMGYADYDVSLTVPQGWIIGATGVLQNPADVLSETTRTRMDYARANPEYIVRLVDEEDLGRSTQTSATGALTWRFSAERVRDFAWGTSDAYLWDMTIADAGNRFRDGVAQGALAEGDRTEIHSFWRPSDGTAWVRSAEFGKYSIEFLSETFFPYPYPTMTAMEGIIGGGMEYPMMTLIGSSTRDRGLFGTTLHEIAHMYFPMIVGQDEKDDTWMDEGLTSFNTTEGSMPFWDDPDGWSPTRQGYYRIAGSAQEIESRRHADQYPYGTSARGIAAYNKPAVSLHALRGMLGQDLFYEAYREYARRWAFKHPEPYDLFNTFEDVVSRAGPVAALEDSDLDWFWTTQFFETFTLDQSVAGVEDGENGVVVTVSDEGLSPYPVPLTVTYQDGTEERLWLPVRPWMEGEREQTARLRAGTVVRVEIDEDEYLPDVDRSNNVWRR